MVVVARFSVAGIWGECSAIHSPPALLLFLEVEISPRTLILTLYARVSPQWLRELRRLCLYVP